MQAKKPSHSFSALSRRLYCFLIGIKSSVLRVSDKYQTILPRFFASIVDGLFLIPLIIIQVAYGRYLTGSMMSLLLSVCWIVLPTAYYVYFIGRHGATPGMRLMQCRAVSIKGEKPLSYVEAALRESPWLIVAIFSALQSHWSAGAAPSVVGVANIWTASTVIWMLLNSKRRGLHDFLSGCVVINESTRAESSIPTYQQRYPHHEAAALIKRFGAGTINFFIFGIILIETRRLAPDYFPTEKPEDVAGWIIVGIAILYWFGCSIARSSPGAFLIHLKIVESDGSTIELRTSFLRNAIYLLMALLAYAPWGESTAMPPITVFRALLLFSAMSGLIISGYTLMNNRTTLIDRWLGIHVISRKRIK